MLAVIVPRGLRATTDTKYNLVRQNASELAAFANDWIEQQIQAQDASSVATRADYLDTLVAVDLAGVGTDDAVWVAEGGGDSNWNTSSSAGLIAVNGRCVNDAPPCVAGTDDVVPENSVEDIVNPAKIPRNPFEESF